MKKTLLFFAAVFLLITELYSQNLNYAETVIRELSSEKYHGRGYYKNGDKKAAAYIAKEFNRYKLKSWKGYYQQFRFDVNTFPASMQLSIDGRPLRAGTDFVIREFCSGFSGDYLVYRVDTAKALSQTVQEISRLDTAKYFVAVEYKYLLSNGEAARKIQGTGFHNFMFIFDAPLKWYVASSGKLYPTRMIWITDEALGKNPQQCKANVQNRFITNHKARNVIGYIEGTHCPDSFYVFTAHYDHLGRHGKDVFYPGANDNASGVAMLLNLAEYYSKPGNAPRYSIVFMAFAGEETGLLGSFYYVDNPHFNLSRIVFLMNFDMIADNCKLVYTELSTTAAKGFGLMHQLNEENNWFDGFDVDELSGNSDHYPFAQKDVPAVFFLDHGDAFTWYHTPYDTFNEKSLTNFGSYFKLAVQFVENYRKQGVL